MWIKDLETGMIHKYGTNRHDSLVISEDGKYLSYYNLQNGDGSGEHGGYVFVTNENGHTPEEDRSCYDMGEEYFNIGGWREGIKAEVQNVPKDADKYIVARLVMGELWYWGSWETKKAADRVAEQFDNGVVLERCE